MKISSEQFITFLYIAFFSLSFDKIIIGQWKIEPLISGSNQNLNTISHFNSDTLIASGSGGTLLRSTNGGVSWNSGVVNPATEYWSSSFVASGIGWVVGSGGTIIKTTDAGTTWNPQSSGTTGSLNGVYAFDDQNAIAVGDGGKVLKTTNGGTNWISQSPPVIGTLRSVHFIDGQNGFTAGGDFGGSGYIFKTTDGGSSWTLVATTSYLLTAIQAVSHSVAYCVGIKGYAYRSTNGGLSWNSMDSGTPHWLYTLHFLKENDGFIMGGNVNEGLIHYTANEIDWTRINANLSQWLYGCTFPNSSNGFVVGYNGKILKLYRGGWIIQSLNSGSNQNLNTISHFNSDTLIASGSGGTLLRSTNGGVSWNSGVVNPATEYWSSSFVASGIGWVVGSGGTIIKTTDAGTTWNPQSSGTTGSLNGVYAFDDQNAIAVGDGGKVLKTTNGGTNWISQSPPVIGTLRSVHFIDGQNGFTAGGDFGGSGYIFKTTDGGSSWTLVATTSYLLTAIQAVSHSVAYCVGIKGYAYRSTNGGLSWNSMDSGTPHWLYTLHFLKENDGFIMGGNVNEGLIHYTANEIDWTRINANLSQWLYGCTFPNSSNGFVVGYNGKIFKLSNFYLISPNGGESWPKGSNQNIEWVYDGDINNIRIEYSTNNGSTWITIINSTLSSNKKYPWSIPSTLSTQCRVKISDVIDARIFDISDSQFSITEPVPVELVSFVAKQKGEMIILTWRTITETNNYGFDIERCDSQNEWGKIGFVHGSGNSNSPKDYSFSDKNPFGGNVLKYRLKQVDNDGRYEYSDAVEIVINVRSYLLEQNFPNPFNPTTKIRYHLPEPAKITLKVYDVLGNEVFILVNEDKTPGIYEVDFNAEKLSSGVYSYKLDTGTFCQIKKMIILK